MEDYIEQNYEDDEPQLLEKKLLVNRHKIPSYKPPPQPHHLPHHHPHHPHGPPMPLSDADTDPRELGMCQRLVILTF